MRRIHFFSDLPPQEQLILNHLLTEGSITDAEARTVHRVRSVSRRITSLLDAGCSISKQQKRDVTGQRYVRYVFESAPERLIKRELFMQRTREQAYA